MAVDASGLSTAPAFTVWNIGGRAGQRVVARIESRLECNPQR
jgi:hypothetical protein